MGAMTKIETCKGIENDVCGGEATLDRVIREGLFEVMTYEMTLVC